MNAGATPRLLMAAAVLVLASGCATTPAPGAPGTAGTPGAGAAAAARNPVDPWEAWNRKVFAFNEAVDEALLKPAAEFYRKAVPQLVRTGIGNVLGNIGDVWSTANHFLQGKVQTGFEMGMRVLTNTFFGLGGLLDPASEMKLPRRSEDFGQTLGTWGLGNGPYVVLPFVGPSTVRDTAGFAVDRSMAPSQLPETANGRGAVLALELVNTRANLLETGNLVSSVALDKYAFFRDAYLSRRRDALYDGAPPLETFDDEDDPNTTGGAGTAPARPTPAPPAGAASAPAPK